MSQHRVACVDLADVLEQPERMLRLTSLLAGLLLVGACAPHTPVAPAPRTHATPAPRPRPAPSAPITAEAPPCPWLETDADTTVSARLEGAGVELRLPARFRPQPSPDGSAEYEMWQDPEHTAVLLRQSLPGGSGLGIKGYRGQLEEQCRTPVDGRPAPLSFLLLTRSDPEPDTLYLTMMEFTTPDGTEILAAVISPSRARRRELTARLQRVRTGPER